MIILGRFYSQGLTGPWWAMVPQDPSQNVEKPSTLGDLYEESANIWTSLS